MTHTFTKSMGVPGADLPIKSAMRYGSDQAEWEDGHESRIFFVPCAVPANHHPRISPHARRLCARANRLIGTEVSLHQLWKGA